MPKQRDTLDLDRLRSLFKQHRIESGQRVRDRRKELGMRMDAVAEFVGVPLQTVSKIERGDILPRDYLKAALAVTLACEVSDLWPYPTRMVIAQTAA